MRESPQVVPLSFETTAVALATGAVPRSRPAFCVLAPANAVVEELAGVRSPQRFCCLHLFLKLARGWEEQK